MADNSGIEGGGQTEHGTSFLDAVTQVLTVGSRYRWAARTRVWPPGGAADSPPAWGSAGRARSHRLRRQA